MSDKVKYIALIILSVIGAAFVLAGTSRYGIGTSPDAATYIGAARNLVDGRGFVMTYAGGELRPMTMTPPMFPLMTAAVSGAFAVDALTGARWLNALAFSGSIILIGLMVSRLTSSIWLTLLASYLMLASANMLHVHSMAWSEPLFIFFSLLGLFLLDIWFDSKRLPLLISASLAVGAAFFTRYPGAPLIAASACGILLLTDDTLKRKIINCAVLTALSSIPVFLWIIRNMYTAKSATGRIAAWHPVDLLKFVKGGLYALSVWLFPGIELKLNNYLLTIEIIMLLLIVVQFIMLLFLVYKNMKSKTIIENEQSSRLLKLIVIFFIFYTAFFIIAVSFFDAGTGFNTRTLSLFYPLFVVLALSVVHKLVTAANMRVIKNVTVVFFVVFACYYTFLAVIWGVQRYKNGQGYFSSYFEGAKIINELKRLPDDAYIYANDRSAVYFLAGKGASSIPPRTIPTAKLANKNYSSQMAVIKSRLEGKKAYIVYFRLIDREYLPEEDELIKELGLELIFSDNIGSIYGRL